MSGEYHFHLGFHCEIEKDQHMLIHLLLSFEIHVENGGGLIGF